VLTDARTALSQSGCAQVAFTTVPDSVSGAYVFRNGFPEALGTVVTNREAVAPACTFTWVDGRFSSSK